MTVRFYMQFAFHLGKRVIRFHYKTVILKRLLRSNNHSSKAKIEKDMMRAGQADRVTAFFTKADLRLIYQS